MARTYNFRWNDKDKKNLNKAVKNFNAKITRLEKKIDKILATSPDKDAREQAKTLRNALPERVSAKELKDKYIVKRQDLNREIKSLQRFTDRGAEELIELPGNKNNTRATKWQIEDIRIRTKNVNKNRAKMLKAIKDLPATSRGQDLGYNVGMGDTDLTQFEPLTPFNPSMDRTSLNARHRSVKKEGVSKYWQDRNDILRDAYIKKMYETFGEREETKKLEEKIRSYSQNDFYSLFKQDVDAWTWVYKDDESQIVAKYQSLEEMWYRGVVRPKVKPKKKKSPKQ